MDQPCELTVKFLTDPIYPIQKESFVLALKLGTQINVEINQFQSREFDLFAEILDHCRDKQKNFVMNLNSNPTDWIFSRVRIIDLQKVQKSFWELKKDERWKELTQIELNTSTE